MPTPLKNFGSPILAWYNASFDYWVCKICASANVEYAEQQTVGDISRHLANKHDIRRVVIDWDSRTIEREE